jgi:hypothetical protein
MLPLASWLIAEDAAPQPAPPGWEMPAPLTMPRTVLKLYVRAAPRVSVTVVLLSGL